MSLDQPTHPCVRCGRPVPLDIAMCEDCNPLGLSQPAASQVHGTVALGIILAVVGLAIVGRLALAGVGPFSGKVTNVIPASPGLTITLTVTNDGSTAGSTTCRVYVRGESGIGPQNAYLVSPRIEPGRSVSFSRQTTELGSEVRPLAAECTGP